MIGCSKLLCGTATVAEVMRLQRDSEKLPAHMLQFSADMRPLVVWNMTNRCNLRCLHCYINAEDKSYHDELTNQEARAFIEDICAMKAPVLLFSGGEPLIHKDIFELGSYAKKLGTRPVISSNGTLIDTTIARQIKETGFEYVGISIDGVEETHDHFRQKKGCFKAAIKGIKNCLDAGVKAGVRITVNKHNYKDLPAVLDIVENEGIPRFCMYHLVYSGRGKEMVQDDLTHEQSRWVMSVLIDKTLDWNKRDVKAEILTTDNHADGVYLLQYVRKHMPEREQEVVELLKLHGGCSAGGKFSNVDPRGNVHPCQFWSHVTLGNIRQTKFSQIWTDMNANPLIDKLRNMQQHVKGRCGICNYKHLCGGCRIRAEVVNKDTWGQDPACYLTDAEISG
ncbi:MAG: radical SAM protein [Candidatus Schekmanbacteria bacterium]|nr:radical SAM protein [Candidatus Schekmanbacteria bacterium]